MTLPALPALPALPHWCGYALLGLALAVTIAGRHGLRIVNGALLCVGAFCAAFFGLRDVLHDWLPGVAAILLGAIGLLLGLAQPAAGTGSVVSAICAPLGYLAAVYLKLAWEVPVMGSAIVGFALGFTNWRRLALTLPPLFAAAFAALGAELVWHPRYPRDLKFAAAAILAVALIAIALERAHRARLRTAAGAKRVEDDVLKKKVSAQQAAWRRTHGGDPPPDVD